MSVVIALIGIINTMSLSILERRRELGLLRIIGMTDKRVRRMVTLESVLISLLGTLGGLLTGLVVSLLLVLSFNRLSAATIDAQHPLARAHRDPGARRPARCARGSAPGPPVDQDGGAGRDRGELIRSFEGLAARSGLWCRLRRAQPSRPDQRRLNGG